MCVRVLVHAASVCDCVSVGVRACMRALSRARACAHGCVAGIKDQHPPTAWYPRHRSHHHQCLAQSAPVLEEICHRKPTPSASPPNPPVHHAELYVCWRVLHVCLLGCQVHSCRNAKTPGALVWKRKNRRSRKKRWRACNTCFTTSRGKRQAVVCR